MCDPVRLVRSFDRVAEIPAQYLCLFDDAEHESFDLGIDWFALLETCGLSGSVKPRYYVLTSGGRVRCILPLTVCQYGLASLSSFYTTLFRPLVSNDLTVSELVTLLEQVISDFNPVSLNMAAMDPSHFTFQLLIDSLRKVNLKSYVYFAFGNWYLPVRGISYVEYIASLGSRTQNTIRRRTKKFKSSGAGRLEIVTADENLENAIMLWNQVYESSWKTPEPYPDFMPGLIRLCARKRWLRMGLAYYDNKPIAAQIWIVNGSKASIYKLAYDESFQKHSAGTILTSHLMHSVFELDHVDEVDYLVGDDAYKKEWMRDRRERYGIIAYNLSTFSGVVGSVRQWGGEQLRRFTSFLKMLKRTYIDSDPGER